MHFGGIHMPKPLDSHHEQIGERVASLLEDQSEIENRIDEMRALCSHPQHGGNTCLVCGQQLDIGASHPEEDEESEAEPACANFAQ